MKNTLRSIVLAVGIITAPALVAPVAGCGQTTETERRQNLLTIGDAYIGVTRTLITARRTGEIGDDAWTDDINPAIQEGRDIYNDLVDAEIAGDTSTAATLRVALAGVVDRLQRAREDQ